MRFPWANTVLLILLVIQFLTGFFGFTAGAEPARWVLWLHGIFGFGIVALLLRKGSIILDAFRRGLEWNLRRLGFLGLVALLVMILVSGLVWTFNGPIYLKGLSLVTIHVLLSLGLLGLLVWHAWYMRFILRHPESRGRRLFMRTAVTGVLGLALWRLTNWGKMVAGLAGTERRFTGSYETGSFTGIFPSTIWIADRPEPVDPVQWRLEVTGMVDNPLFIGYQEFLYQSSDELTATLDCTGGWYTTQKWQGVMVARLLETAGLQDGARSVVFEAVSGYRRRFSLEESQAYLLATSVAGIKFDHWYGFPLRLVAPGKRGYDWVKWVRRVEVSPVFPELQSPLPLM